MNDELEENNDLTEGDWTEGMEQATQSSNELDAAIAQMMLDLATLLGLDPTELTDG